MQGKDLKRLRESQKPTSSEYLPTVEPVSRSQGIAPSPSDGLSFPRTVADDVKESMQAVGQVCRAVMVGVLLCGFGGTAALLSLLLF